MDIVRTHIGMQNNRLYSGGDWLEIQKTDYKLSVKDASNSTDEARELLEELVSILNATKNDVIETAHQNSGAYSFSDAGLRLGGWNYTRR